jgi:hypothetical protein
MLNNIEKEKQKLQKARQEMRNTTSTIRTRRESKLSKTTQACRC